jgi:hypothetical protein
MMESPSEESCPATVLPRADGAAGNLSAPQCGLYGAVHSRAMGGAPQKFVFTAGKYRGSYGDGAPTSYCAPLSALQTSSCSGPTSANGSIPFVNGCPASTS